tara:strand:+ start:1516 stop:2403 length:888 start_codon:yes stop_codon:yes gene_type:complete
MAYLGTPPRVKVLTSADIAEGAVTLNDISFTDQPTNMDITGTYDKHTMRLADGITVVGDVTITDNLILSKISDDGNAITLTNDSSTRTITGTGSLEASTLTQTPNASLTGMTGELGSAVTGSPNLNLTTGSIGSGVTGFTGVKNLSKWLIPTSFGHSSGTNVLTNFAVVPSTRGYSALGTDMTFDSSSGVFTFPSTGYWLITFFCAGRGNSAAPVVTANIETTTDNSSYSAASLGFWYSGGDPTKTQTAPHWLFDVTSTTTHKCRFSVGVTAAAFFECSSTVLQNGAMFMRLGDT